MVRKVFVLVVMLALVSVGTVFAQQTELTLLGEKDRPVQIGDNEGYVADIRHMNAKFTGEYWEAPFDVTGSVAVAGLYIKVSSLAPEMGCATVVVVNGKTVANLEDGLSSGTDRTIERNLAVPPEFFKQGKNLLRITERHCVYSKARFALNDSVLHAVRLSFTFAAPEKVAATTP